MAIPSIEEMFDSHPELLPEEPASTELPSPVLSTKPVAVKPSTNFGSLVTYSRPEEREPGIWAPQKTSFGEDVLHLIGGRTLTEPVSVIRELLFSPDRLETAKETAKDVLQLTLKPAAFAGAAGLELMQSLTSPSSSNEEIALNAGLVGLFTPGKSKWLGGPIKYAFKGMKGALDVAYAPIKYADEALRPVTNYVWENIVVPPFKARILPTLERSLEGRGATEVVKKSIADVMQPAVERMSKNLQSTFRTTQAMKALTTKTGEELGQDLRSLTPTARYDVVRGLRGTSQAQLSPEAVGVLDKFEGRIQDMQLRGPYELEFRNKVSKLLTKSVEAPEEMFLGPAPRAFLQSLEQGLSGKASVRQIQRTLVSAIEDPLVAPEFKALARMVHNLPASIPEEVAQASKDTATAYLASKLKGYSGVVRAYDPKPGSGDYLASKWAPFVRKGEPLFVQRDVELELRALQAIPKIAHSMFNKYFLSPWKMTKIMPRPAAQMRNLFSNTMLNHIGGLPFWHLDTYTQALRGMQKGSPEWKQFSRTTGAGGNFSVNEINTLHEGLRYNANMIDGAMSVFDRVMQPSVKLYNAQESMFKFAKYLHNLDQGISKSEAAWDAVKWTFNYGEVTRFTARVRSNLAPFYTWQSKIIPLMAEAAVKNPVQFTTMISLYQALQNYGIRESGITDSEWQSVEGSLPEYIKKGMFFVMPWRDDQGRLNMMNMTYMLPGFGDVNQLLNGPMAFFLSNPALTIAGSLLTKTKYSGAPMYYDWEAPGTKFAKSAAYVWEQLMPAVMPGGTDWNMLWDTFTDVPESLSGPQALASMLGMKMSPVNLEAAQRKAQAIEQIHLSEMGIQMNHELRRARNDSEREDILYKYAQLKESRAQEREERGR